VSEGLLPHGATDPQAVAAGVRSLLLEGMPLLVADLPRTPAGALVHGALAAAGLAVLPALSGTELPRGARVGVQLEGADVRLVDERDTTLLRLARAGLDPGWLQRAVALRGTMLVVVTGLGVAALGDPAALVAAIDTTAAGAPVIGAIVGVHDRRPRLPLLF
jgi:hypothetical protein